MAVSPSSSSSSGVNPSPCEYDVFISYKANDTGKGFTSHLYAALIAAKIETYIDKKSLEKGEDISRALPKAIAESSISIIIFSTNYASSTWCLDELVQILTCQKEKNQIVLPIFHSVDPSNIEQEYDSALLEHGKRVSNEKDKVKEWKDALIKAPGFSGWNLRGKDEADIIKEVVGKVKKELQYSNGALENLRKELEEQLKSANDFLEDAEEKQLTNKNVREWLLEMKEVKYKAEELLDKINYEELKRKQEADSKS